MLVLIWYIDVLCHEMSAYLRILLKHCIIWSPSLRPYIDSIEQVQRRFTKTLHVFRHYSYDQWSNLLNLKKLETRRLQQDLIWCYKILGLFGIVRVDPNAFFELRVTTTRGHPYKWYKRYNSCSAGACFFTDIGLLMFGISNQSRLLILQHCSPAKEPLTILT